MRYLLRFTLFFIGIHCFHHANATVKDFIGPANGSWDVAANWSPSGIPAIQDTVQSGYGKSIVVPAGFNAKAKRAYLIGDFILNGSLEINGSGLRIAGDFTNNGTLSVINSAQYGIEIESLQTSYNAILINNGSIVVNGTAAEGIKGVFRNELYNYGTIDILNYTTHGLYVEYGENEGVLRIDDSGTNAVYSNLATDEFINQECGKWIVFNKWNIVEGTITNNGFLKQESDETHFFQNDLINNGILEDINGDFSSLNIDNNAIWVKKFFTQCSEGIPVQIFTISNSTGFTFSDIYKNNNLTLFAGPYDNALKTWTPNQAAAGDSVFFAEVTNLAMGCKDTVKLTLQNPVFAVNYWVGGIGNWNVANKWSYGHIPTPTEKAAVYDELAEITIPNGQNIVISDFNMKGKLTINPTATLTINDNPSGYSFTCNSGELINRGNIYVKSIDFGMILSNSKFINYKNISCDSMQTCLALTSGSSTDTSIYTKNYGTIIGAKGGLIGGYQMPFYNYHNIAVTDAELETIENDAFHNYGNVSITGQNTLNGYGFLGNMTNYPSGVIEISNIHSGMNGSIYNMGAISINNTYYGIYGGNSENQSGGTILVDDSFYSMFITSGTFFNKSNGFIQIKNSGFGLYVLDIFGSAISFTNEGNLSIDSMLYDGILIGDEFKNIGNANLSINHVGRHGVNTEGLADLFYNESTNPILINNCGEHGLKLKEGIFENKAEGTIIVDSVGQNAFHFKLEGAHPFSTLHVENEGKLVAKENVAGYSFFSSTPVPFTNSACTGLMISNSPFELQGTFANQGIFKQLKDASSTIFPGFTNTGIIQDNFTVFQGANFTNSGYHIVEKLGSYSALDVIVNPILNANTGVPPFTISGNWYLNKELTVLGGTYNSTNNTFTPNFSAIDSSTFYFEATNTTCTPDFIEKLSITFENPINTACTNYTWLGGSGNWANTAKWDKNRLPTVCDTVIIANQLDSIQLNNAQIVQLNKLNNSGILLITAISQMEIVNSPASGFINSGSVINQGTLIVSNPGTIGFQGLANSSLTNFGNMQILNAGTDALSVTNGIVDNKVGGQITLSNSANNNILLNQNSLFLQRGSLISN